MEVTQTASALMTGASMDVSRAERMGGLSLLDLERFLSDMRETPAWRQRADMECDYYDGNQHSPEDIQRYRDRGLPVVTTNMIKPVIDMVIGMEAKTRRDWVVRADGTGSLTNEQADGLSVKVNEAERMSYADMACSLSFAAQVKGGLGWCEVAKESDPFRYPHRVMNVDRREIWWDMRSQDLMLRDARWLCRKKWHDLDILLTRIPKKLHRYVDAAMSTRSQWDYSQFTGAFPYLQDDLIRRDWLTADMEWRDTDRNRVCAYEVWYRKAEAGFVLKYPDGRNVKFDKNNPMQVAAIASGLCEPVYCDYQSMRLSWWVGPFRLMDVPSPHAHHDFPYIPFWGFVEDGSRTPYGMVRAMVSLQNEINARRARMMWQLGTVRAIVEEDAVADHNAVIKELARPDVYVRVNPKRMNRNRGVEGSIKIDDHPGLNAQQWQVYQDAMQTIQRPAGVYPSMMGDSSGGADAGVAIAQLVEQGQMTLAGIFANYERARTEVGRRLLLQIVADMEGKQNIRVAIPPMRATSQKASVVFNQPKEDPNFPGAQYLSNDVTKLMWTMDLEDEPSSPTQVEKRVHELVEYAKSLPPELQVVFADVVVQASPLRFKDQLAERIRKVTGMAPIVDPDNATPEEMMEMQQQQAAQARGQQIQEQQIAAELDAQASTSEKNRAGAELARAQTSTERLTAIELAAKLRLAPINSSDQPGSGPPGAGPDGGGFGDEGGEQQQDGPPGAQQRPAAPPAPVASEADLQQATLEAAVLENPRPHPEVGADAQAAAMPSPGDDRVSLGQPGTGI